MTLAERADLTSIPIAEWLYVNAGLVWVNQREIMGHYLDSDYSTEGHVIAWLIRRGEVTVKNSTDSVTAKKGCWIFPGQRRGRQKFKRGTVILSLRFFAEWPTGKLLFDHSQALVFRAAADPGLTMAGETLEAVVRRVTRRRGFFLLNQGDADVESYFAIRQAFETWMLAYSRTMLRLKKMPSVMASADPRVLRAARLIDGLSLRRPWKETDIARATGLSVSQLNRLFARDLGTSPKKYFQRRRLQAAMLLLQHDKRPVKETAFELGFNAISNFSNWFFRQKGLFPKAFQDGG